MYNRITTVVVVKILTIDFFNRQYKNNLTPKLHYP